MNVKLRSMELLWWHRISYVHESLSNLVHLDLVLDPMDFFLKSLEQHPGNIPRQWVWTPTFGTSIYAHLKDNYLLTSKVPHSSNFFTPLET